MSSSILDRFRPIGAPGAAGRTGIPARGLLGPEQELAVVFAALESDLASADAAVARAAAAAATARATAVTDAAEIVARAQRSAPVDQAEAASRIASAAAAEDAQLSKAALVEAAAVRRRGARRLPALLRRTQEALLKEIG
jgi:hypothetical protein